MGFCCRGFAWGGWMGWGGGWIGLLLNVALFVGVLILLGLAAVWIARRRLAAGEITVAEFEDVRDRLRG